MHHGLGALAVLALTGAIAFAFGERAAKAFLGTVLVGAALFLAYVMWRIAEGTI